MRFENRTAAGIELAVSLKNLELQNLLILGIPRGGVVIGKSIRNELGGDLGIVVTRKIGFPGNPEYGVGAVAEDGTTVLSEAGEKSKQITEEYLEIEKEKQIKEIERRLRSYHYSLPDDLGDKTIVVVDDGIATGMTVLAALRFLRKKKPNRLILAVPVAPADTLEKLQGEADDIICLFTPRLFYAVGQFYKDFTQIEDDEVISNLHGEDATF